MSGKELPPVPLHQVGNAPPLAVHDADPLRFRVGEPDPKTREFAAFLGDHHRYFAAAAAAAAASAPRAHPEFLQNFYSERPIRGNPPDSGGTEGDDDVDEDDEEDDDVDGNADCHVTKQGNAKKKDDAGEGVSLGAG